MSLLHRLAYAFPYHFWAVWVIGLFAVVAVPCWMFRRGAKRGADSSLDLGLVEGERPSALLTGCFAVFLVLYIAFMLWGEDFAYKDGHWFTEFSAIGKARPPAIWPSVGRFWPLGYQEYNLIAYLSRTATAYLSYGAAQLVLGLWLLHLALPRESPALRLLAFVLLLSAPAFGADFAELTYADRNVAFALCVVAFAVGRYEQRPGATWLVLAIGATYCALFYKETSVVLFGGFAGTRLLLKILRDGARESRSSPLEIGMLLACGYFSVDLGLTLLQPRTASYVDGNSVGCVTAALRYLAADPLLTAFLVVFTVQFVLVLRARATFDPLWDSLAVGAVLHFAGVASTGVAETYLLGPTELVAAVTLLRLMPRWWNHGPGVRALVACLAAATMAASLAFGTFRLLQRKYVVWQTEKIADFLVNYYERESRPATRLYFVAEDSVVMDFVSYLSYRGLTLHRIGERPGAGAIEVAGSAPFESNLCMSWYDLVCRQDVARPGDLVVRLPEEAWSPAPREREFSATELGAQHARLERLFQASPPGAASIFRPVLSLLHGVSPTLTGVFYHQPLPDRWLEISAARVVAHAGG